MFRDHELNWKPIIWLFVFIATVIWFAIFLIQGLAAEVLLNSALRFALVCALVFGFWRAFVQSGWRIGFVSKYLANNLPDISGRWEGTYISKYDNKPREMILEIQQTLFNIECISWGKNSTGEIYSAHILTNNTNSNFKLLYAYRAMRNPTYSIAGDKHDGLVILSLVMDTQKKLNGYYMNDRDPSPTKGSISLIFKSKKLRGAPK